MGSFGPSSCWRPPVAEIISIVIPSEMPAPATPVLHFRYDMSDAQTPSLIACAPQAKPLAPRDDYTHVHFIQSEWQVDDCRRAT